MSSNKQTKGAAKVSKSKHDIGLTDAEKVFVHAMRAMFDPKGKGKDISTGLGRSSTKEFWSHIDHKKSKDFVSRKDGAEKRPGASKPVRTAKGKQSVRNVMHSREAGLRKKSNGKVRTMTASEKMKKAVKLSPSKLRRAEKRSSLNSGRSVLAGVSSKEVARNRQMKRFRVQAVPGFELEVAKAFGGERALKMLADTSKSVKAYTNVVYWNQFVRNRVSGETRDFGTEKTTRDYSKIKLDMRADTSAKRADVHCVKGRGRKPKPVGKSAEKLGAISAEKGPTQPKTPRKLGSSALRRKERRKGASIKQKDADKVSELSATNRNLELEVKTLRIEVEGLRSSLLFAEKRVQEAETRPSRTTPSSMFGRNVKLRRDGDRTPRSYASSAAEDLADKRAEEAFQRAIENASRKRRGLPPLPLPDVVGDDDSGPSAFG